MFSKEWKAVGKTLLWMVFSRRVPAKAFCAQGSRLD